LVILPQEYNNDSGAGVIKIGSNTGKTAGPEEKSGHLGREKRLLYELGGS